MPTRNDTVPRGTPREIMNIDRKPELAILKLSLSLITCQHCKKNCKTPKSKVLSTKPHEHSTQKTLQHA